MASPQKLVVNNEFYLRIYPDTPSQMVFNDSIGPYGFKPSAHLVPYLSYVQTTETTRVERTVFVPRSSILIGYDYDMEEPAYFVARSSVVYTYMHNLKTN